MEPAVKQLPTTFDPTMCDPKGTAFNREVGMVCPACGANMAPRYMGNTLICLKCPNPECGREQEAET